MDTGLLRACLKELHKIEAMLAPRFSILNLWPLRLLKKVDNYTIIWKNLCQCKASSSPSLFAFQAYLPLKLIRLSSLSGSCRPYCYFATSPAPPSCKTLIIYTMWNLDHLRYEVMIALAIGLLLCVLRRTFIASVDHLRFVRPLLLQLVAFDIWDLVTSILRETFFFCYITSTTSIISKQV